VLENLHPFLQELNPILSFANFDQNILAGFLTASTIADNVDLNKPGEQEDGIFDYALQQFGVINNTSLSINRTRPAYDTGNSYPDPNYGARGVRLGIFESFDCKSRGGEVRQPDAANKLPPCYVKAPSLFSKTLYPLVQHGRAPNIPSPGASNPTGTRPARP
jgi:hypothetical protein